jgi:hypothetical protein
MNRVFRTFVLFALLATTACVGALGTADVSDKLKTAPPETMGAVVGSIGIVRKGTFYRRYDLLARNLETNEQLRFQYTDDGFAVTKVDFREDPTEAALIALPLPAGRYAIEDFQFIGTNLRFQETRTEAPGRFSLPFDVKAGQTTYIGQYLVVPVISWRFLGAKGVREIVWEIADRRERDLALARQRLPEAMSVAVIIAVPDARALRLPWFYPAGGAPPDETGR